MAKVVVDFEVKDAGANRAFKRITKQSGKTTVSIQKGFANAGRIFDNFVAGLASRAVFSGLNKLTNAAEALFDTFVVSGVRAAQVQENAISELNAAMVRTGEFSSQASQGMQAFASAMQQSTTFGDEVILQQVALAKAFGATNEQAKVATQAATELSVAAGINLEEATRRVGRAMQGSVEDISKFAPAIKQLTEEELRAGKAAELLVEALGGTAGAQINTFAGAAAQAENPLGDLQEVLGNLITQNPSFIGALRAASEVFTEMSEFVRANKTEIQALVTDAFLAVIDALPLVIQGLDFFVEQVQKVKLGIQALGIVVSSILGRDTTESIEALNEGLAGFGQTRQFFDNLKQGAQEFGERVRGSIEETKAAQDGLNESLIAQNEIRRIAFEEQQLQEEFNQETRDRLKEFQEQQAIAGSEDALQTQQRLQAQRQFLKERLDNEKTFVKQREQLERELVKTEAEIQKQRQANLNSSLGTISTLQQSSSKELFAIGKAAALALAIIDAEAATVKALASAPPPVNFALAAAVGAAAAVNIATIAAQKPPGLQSGIDSVPGFGTQDTFPAMLAPGERVVPSETNQDLTSFLQNENETRSLLAQILAVLQGGRGGTVINIGGRTVLDTLNDELEAGGELSLA